MHRWLAFLLLSAYLCSVTEMHQLFKVPALFEHFAEDLNERPDESFLCFLADHYFDGAHHEAEDQEEHGNLPFHNHHDRTSHALQIVCPIPHGSIAISNGFSLSEPPLLDDASYSFLLSRDVWQPPKA